MGYRFKPGESVGDGVTRIARKQLELAADRLANAGPTSFDVAVHVARRHIKKVRALRRLIAPVLAPGSPSAGRSLRHVARSLGPETDAAAIIDTFRRVRGLAGTELTRRTALLVHRMLVHRKRRIVERAQAMRVLETAVAQLRSERRRVAAWRLTADGFAAIAPGLERTYRRARQAMAAATAQPRRDSYHVWRRRVKDHWLQTRLISPRCGGGLDQEVRRLERLDGYLGEYHNCIVLENVLTSRTLDSRLETARVLRLVRRYERTLARAALDAGAALYGRRARQYVRRVGRLWNATQPESRKEGGSWPRAA